MPSYQEFKNQVLGRAYDIDGYYGAQCWDGYAKYAQYLGQPICHCTSSGYVKDIWNLRGSNGILNYNSEVNILQAGDIVVFRECSATPLSHIAIFDSDAGGGYGNFLGQNQGAAGGAFNIVRLPYSATFDTAFRPNQFVENALDHLQAETGVATLTYDNIQARLNGPTGSVVRKYMAGDQITYAWKYVGNGHRYIVWKEGDNYIFLAVSNSEIQGVEPWATFAPVQQDIGYSDSQLIQENGVAHFTHDNIIIRKGSPDGEDTSKRFMSGQSQEYTEKWIGNGHRYISWVEDGVRYFAAVSGSETQGEDPWATFTAPEEVEEKPTDPVTPPEEKPEKPEFPESVKMVGIDVSEHNADDIDFTPYDFVILRANWWTTTDKKFDQFADKLEELGIPYGVYCYDYCGDEASALEQAEYTFSLIKDRNIQMGVWMDMEDADGWKQKNGYLTKEHCSMVCKVFCDFFKTKGYFTGVYSTKYWFETYCPTDYPKWVANWGTNDGTCQDDFADYGVLHQYTSYGGMDKNVAYHDLDYYKSDPIVDTPETPADPESPEEGESIDGGLVNKLVKLLIKLVNKLLSIFK